eukprot:3169-Heterococcus_DN1.PRE.1
MVRALRSAGSHFELQDHSLQSTITLKADADVACGSVTHLAPTLWMYTCTAIYHQRAQASFNPFAALDSDEEDAAPAVKAPAPKKAAKAAPAPAAKPAPAASKGPAKPKEGGAAQGENRPER